MMFDDVPKRRILIVEDDYLIASSLADSMRELGCEVVGPFSSVDEAVAAVDHITAAVVDVHLGTERCFALADCLVGQQIPFLFYTAYGRAELPHRFHGVSLFSKPTAPRVLWRDLLRQHEHARRVEPYDSSLAIPLLRRRAADLIPDVAAADRLVESALREAIAHPVRVTGQEALDSWLLGLVEREFRRHAGRFLH